MTWRRRGLSEQWARGRSRPCGRCAGRTAAGGGDDVSTPVDRVPGHSGPRRCGDTTGGFAVTAAGLDPESSTVQGGFSRHLRGCHDRYHTAMISIDRTGA
jgi:hypothetical protein